MTVKVLMNEFRLLEMLEMRLKELTDDKETIALYMDMYERYIDDGVFESQEFDPLYIVDNDFINYCATITTDEPGFQDLLDIYREFGLGDCSDCDTGEIKASYIEAVDDENDPTTFLIRY